MDKPGIHSGRLTSEEYRKNFSDIKPAYGTHEATIEASRCLFCEAAPCITACPTDINIPSFINRIATDNIEGAAHTILESNILGGSCARICPTEILCEQACVRNKEPECVPVNIGRLQRFAVDNREGTSHPFSRNDTTGKSVAVVGAGPAGLACAHALARKGHDVDLFDAREKHGGLNEYGIAAYKLVEDYAQKEVKFVLEIGGITQKFGSKLGTDIQLDDLRNQYDAVFLGLGLGDSNKLGIENESMDGVSDAISAIAELRQTSDLGSLNIGQKVVVIGAGNTAIDIACQMKRLGAEEVTLVYRRGNEQMSATEHEQKFALENGVRILTWMKPVALETRSSNNQSKDQKSHVTGITLERTHLDDNNRLKGLGEYKTLEADTVFKAIGQSFLEGCFSGSQPPTLIKGRIQTESGFKTTLNNVWAGGDCIEGDEDLAVQAVEHGKQAAQSIDCFFQSTPLQNASLQNASLQSRSLKSGSLKSHAPEKKERDTHHG